MSEPRSPDVLRLAALDAGLLDPYAAAALRAEAAVDAPTRAVLDALVTTRAELAAQPRPALPPDVAARITTALDRVDGAKRDAAVRRSMPSATMPTTGSSGRRASRARPVRGPDRWRRRRPRRGVAATLVAVAVVGAGTLVAHLSGPAGASPVLELRADELAAAGAATVGTSDLGPLDDPVRRSGCLREVGLAGRLDPVLGGRQVVLDGRPGVLLVLPTGVLGHFRLVVVDQGCGPRGGILLADRAITG